MGRVDRWKKEDEPTDRKRKRLVEGDRLSGRPTKRKSETVGQKVEEVFERKRRRKREREIEKQRYVLNEREGGTDAQNGEEAC